MIKYFLYPIIFLIIGVIALFYAIDFYKKYKKTEKGTNAFNYTYITLAFTWLGLSLYFFNLILQQFLG